MSTVYFVCHAFYQYLSALFEHYYGQILSIVMLHPRFGKDRHITRNNRAPYLKILHMLHDAS